MPRKSSRAFKFKTLRIPASLPSLKKTSIGTLIAFLLYILFQIGQTVISTPTHLPATNEPIQLYANQLHDDLTDLYITAIQNAKQSLVFAIYALTDPQIIQALKEKNEAGIPVYIVCDAKASRGIIKKLPQAQIIRRFGEGLMHQKILLIDQKQILIGSANMTRESLRLHANLIMGLNHPALAQALAAKIKSMDEEGASTLLRHLEMMVGSQYVELWILPDDPAAVERIIQLLRSAKKSIKVAMFTWTRTDFTQELIQAAKRGVRVEAVIDRYSGKGASAKIVSMLSQEGIPIKLSTGQGLLHHKFVYIDDKILINGSANWTHQAFKTNDDCFLIMNPLTPEQQAKMNALWPVIQKNSERAVIHRSART